MSLGISEKEMKRLIERLRDLRSCWYLTVVGEEMEQVWGY